VYLVLSFYEMAFLRVRGFLSMIYMASACEKHAATISISISAPQILAYICLGKFLQLVYYKKLKILNHSPLCLLSISVIATKWNSLQCPAKARK
jgi:hypothetical protein